MWCPIFLNDIVGFMLALPVMWQLGDEDCILPSKLQAALQQILEEREDILNHIDGDDSEGLEMEQAIFGGWHLLCFDLKCVPSRSAGWPELAGVGGFCKVLCGTGGPLSPPHDGVVQWKQRAPARQFPQSPLVPWRQAVPAAFHGNADVCWIHSGQGAVQGRWTR